MNNSENIAPTTHDDTQPSDDHQLEPQLDASQEDEQEDGFYDDVYFETTDEDDEEKELDTEALALRRHRREERKRRQTKEELLYDSDEDALDEQWYQRRVSRGNKSDAILACAMCLTNLCYDCQRHERYHDQYRAMFVQNVETDFSRALKYSDRETAATAGGAASKKKLSAAKSKQPSDDHSDAVESGLGQTELEGSGNEIYHPVQCATCKTQVAVMDTDEIYHFFRVIATPL